MQEGQSGRFSHRPQQDYPAATVADFRTAVLTLEALIAMGHASGDVWDYTPRRIAGFLRVAQARMSQEKADSLALKALAARGDPKEIKRQHRDLSKSL